MHLGHLLGMCAIQQLLWLVRKLITQLVQLLNGFVVTWSWAVDGSVYPSPIGLQEEGGESLWGMRFGVCEAVLTCEYSWNSWQLLLAHSSFVEGVLLA